jgi:molecular chaperone DnaK
MANDNRTIGKFILEGLPPAMRGVPQIEVTFDIDANGIIDVSAVDKATNKQQSIRIESSSGLSKEEIEKMRLEAEQNADNDKKMKEEIDTLNSADSLMFQIKKSLTDLGDKITEEQKTEITSTIDKLKEAYDQKNVSEVKVLMEEVNNKFQKISQDLYSSAQTNDQEVTEEDFSNVEFEEVK